MNSEGNRCDCKSSCSTKRKPNGTRGCPCKGRNVVCSAECHCGTRGKPCQNKETANKPETKKRKTAGNQRQGFRLTHATTESEDREREKEHENVKNFIATLDANMVKKLAIRSLRRGIGSMDYIETLMMMEDDLDEDDEDVERLEAFAKSSSDNLLNSDPSQSQCPSHSQSQDPNPTPDPTLKSVPDWCTCGKCRPMPQEVENKCCKLKKCITLTSRFAKLCIDPDVLELCIRNRSDIRNDREDNSTRAFRKAGYRQFILSRYGFLGKGNRRVCPSCVVLKIRERYPSVTGVYMGYKDH